MDHDDRRMKQYAGTYWQCMEDLYHYDQMQFAKWGEVLQETNVHPVVRMSWEKMVEYVGANAASSSSDVFGK